MQSLLKKICDRLDGGAYVNEAAVRIGIIEPILTALGWDTTDPTTVLPEFSSEGRRVDYALCAFPARPSVFIEAKAIGKVEAADRQLFEYAFHVGVPFAVLTDGRTWSFYLPAAQGSYEDRRLYKLDLQERSAEECERIFHRYLAFDRLRNGQAQTDAQSDYANRANERMAFDTLNRAWIELLNEPDPLLIELLVERTEALCGIRPTLENGESFILSQQRVSAEQRTISAQPLSRAATPPPPISRVIPQVGRLVSATIGGKSLPAKDATSALLEILRGLISQFPDKVDRIATAAKGRSRNHIARSALEVYPSRPDLAHTVVDLVPGWYIGTNIANREKLRIVKAACDACGVHFGTDVTFDFPNA
jgi:hypothetical protein